ncbi:MAG: hypothetical protein JHC95_07520 [Solirubrobacteraceae bacterium]|nr:hypothetical protein [Solirubrobacteraceae bacterium]
MTPRLALLAITSFALMLGAVSPAGAYVWWTHEDLKRGVGRAALDGTGAQDTFIPSVAGQWAFARGVASDGAHVYWTNHMANTSPSLPFAPPVIARSTVDGADVNHAFTASIGQGTTGMTAGGGYLYWSYGNQDTSGVGRTPIIGGQQYQSIQSVFGQPNPRTCGVAVDDTWVYFANPSTYSIGRKRLSKFMENVDDPGPDMNSQFIKTPVTWMPCGVAVDMDHIYWGIREVGGTTPGSGTSIGRANIDGSDQRDTFWSGNPRITGLAIDDEFVYWSSYGTGMPGTGSVGRGSKATGGSDPSFVGGLTAPWGVAVDGTGPKPAPPTPIGPPLPPPPNPLSVGVSGGSGGSGSGSASLAVPCFIPTGCLGPRPDFSQVWVTRKVFAPAPWNTLISVGVSKASTATAKGTTLNARVDRRSTVKIAIQRKRGKKWTTVVTLTRVAKKERLSVPFSGRIKNKPLKPGGYRAVFKATAAKKTSTPETVTFTVVSR